MKLMLQTYVIINIFSCTCIAYSMEQINPIPKLADLCVATILTNRVPYYGPHHPAGPTLPAELGDKIANRGKELTQELCTRMEEGNRTYTDIEKLLKDGANPSGMKNAVPPLAYATTRDLHATHTRNDHLDIASLLIRAGASFRNYYLFSAAENGNKKLFKLLLYSYFPKTVWNWYPASGTPGYYWTCEEKTNENLWKGLRDNEGNTVFHLAVKRYRPTPEWDIFIRWLFTKHAKYKYIFALNRPHRLVSNIMQVGLRLERKKGKTVLALLNKKRERYPVLGEIYAQYNAILPMCIIEHATDTTRNVFDWLKNTEAISAIRTRFL